MKTFISLLFLFINLYCVGQKTSCRSVKTGSFYIKNGFLGKSFIQRTKKNHIETTEKWNDTLVFSLEWTGKCEYESKYLFGDFTPDSTNWPVLRTRILEVYPDSHIVETKFINEVKWKRYVIYSIKQELEYLDVKK